jgi:hypothetical protein
METAETNDALAIPLLANGNLIMKAFNNKIVKNAEKILCITFGSFVVGSKGKYGISKSYFSLQVLCYSVNANYTNPKFKK